MTKYELIMAGKDDRFQKTMQAEQQARESRMPLSRRDYLLMLIGLGVMLVGFVLMSGGGSDDPTVFNDKMFNFRRITLAPIAVITGLVIEIFAIMGCAKPKKRNQ
jgi:hypothetical protein